MAGPDRDCFVNPYTFAPLPTRVERREAPGHRLKAGERRYSGWIEVAYTLQTPMLLPRGEAGRASKLADGRIRIPGSSLKGAVRSLHEALFNGCFRVVDLDFVPSYRDSAVNPELREHQQGGTGGWRLALVTASDTGSPTQVRLCGERTYWVEAGRLASRFPGQRVPTSGDVIDLRGERPLQPDTLGRHEIGQIDSIALTRTWSRPDEEGREPADDAELASDHPLQPIADVPGSVFLPTSVGARRLTLRDGTRGRALWALGDLTDQLIPVSEVARDDFKSASNGCEDRRRLEADSGAQSRLRGPGGASPTQAGREKWRDGTVHEDVSWWRSNGTRGLVAKRALQTGFLWRGDVIWVRVAGTGEQMRVEGIRLSRLWRHAATTPVRHRLPKDLHPCPPAADDGDASDAKLSLCLSCTVFGAADSEVARVGDGRGDLAATGPRRGGGEQRSYAGHVRFGSATSTSAVMLRRVSIAPLGTPKPGAGVFYLKNTSAAPTRDRARGDKATEWDSQDEANGPARPIAGRKFYWHANPDAQAERWSERAGSQVRPRYEASGRQQEQQGRKMASDGELVPAGTQFTATVTFDHIDEVGLRTLISAIDPAAVLGLVPAARPRRIAVRLGGGKPLGLGSATVRITSVHAEDVSARYGGEGGPVPEDLARGAASAARAVAERVGRFTAGLPALARILDLDGLGDQEEIVSYPPGASWDGIQRDDFRKTYTFFIDASGEQLADGRTRPFYPLPPPTDDDQSLPITRKDR